LPGSCFLNILNMRSEIRSPLTMLVVEAKMATAFKAVAKTNRWKVVGPKRGFLIRGDDRIGVLGGTA
jgi:hypothetical protein